MKDYSLLIKPASSDCNLKCRYCYYTESGSRQAAGKGRKRRRMNDQLLETVIRKYMETDQEIYSMVWHGGEPTLMPRSFFEKAVAFQKQYAAKGSRISNSIQTNAVHLPKDLAAFLGKYRFLCGVSLDGPAQIHDAHRRTKTDGPTHRKVVNGINELASNSVPVNILVLVSSANVGKPLDVYRYLRNCGYSHIQFIPCVETRQDGTLRKYAVSAEDWGRFLSAVFNEWYENDISRVSVRLFESILAKLVHDTAIDCYNSGSCNRYLVVESNGDIFPCDFFVNEEYKLGNIMDKSLDEIMTSIEFMRFSSGKKKWSAECSSCDFLDLCMGDCRKFRPAGQDGTHSKSLLCSGWKIFYKETLDRFLTLAGTIRQNMHSPGKHN